ncbi:MAG TPA: hypothetical protein VHZ03_30165 [Trebonia sp.]|nr:hypothetical protein [Trebonia sp.]
MLRLLRNKLLGAVADASLCPMSLRLLLLRLCGWQIAPGAHLFSARFVTGLITIGELAMVAQEVILQDYARVTIGRRVDRHTVHDPDADP